MTRNDNTVNIKSQGDYHHGDLRAAALSLGLRKLAEQEVPDLGLRELARELGVSATALYRHFANKDALLDALAAEGVRQLGESQQSAIESAGDDRSAFLSAGEAYVHWAVANPALFALTFARKARSDFGTEQGADNRAFQLLQSGISAVLPGIAEGADRAAAAMHAWSLVHGLSHLILAGQIENDPVTIRAVVSRAFGLDRNVPG